MSSINVRKFVKEFKPIEIKQPFKTDVIEFTNTDDFTKYYREHENDFNNISTYKLNVKYKIPGYKISKRQIANEDKKELILIKDYKYKAPKANIITTDDDEQINILQKAINELEKRISNIEDYLGSNN